MGALVRNKTWNLVPKPKDIQPVSYKWVYKIKEDGSIDKYKARLVVRGFSQKYAEDYEETFSPVAKMISFRVVLAIAASHDWKLWQLGVKNAFLYGELDKDIYMDQPPRYVSNLHSNYVCKLKKALYGLKQALRAWYKKIAQYLNFCGYVASHSDPSLFVKKQRDLHVVILLYVDGMIITGNNDDEVARLQKDLAIRFKIKKLGELHHFLGLEVTNTSKGIFVTQEGYAKKLVDRFGMKHIKKCSTPLETSTRLRYEEGSLLADPKPFRSLVGSLLYLTITRLDISFFVGYVSRFMQSPRKPHLEVAKRILKYINSTLDMDLFFQKKNDLILVG